MTLGNNPWRCDSTLALLIELDKGSLKIDGAWQQGHKLGRVWILDYPDMECAEPPPLAGTCLLNLSKLTLIFTFSIHTNDTLWNMNRHISLHISHRLLMWHTHKSHKTMGTCYIYIHTYIHIHKHTCTDIYIYIYIYIYQSCISI